jgi:DNA polymerase delta subunit 1
MLNAKAIAATVTSEGRRMIQTSKDFTEEKFFPNLNILQPLLPYKVKVIYGDTDSIFINFIVPSNDLQSVEIRRDIMRLATICADRITDLFAKKPISLEFEKVYNPLILFKKKRYIGALFTKPETYDKIDTKGVVLKRRDNCPFIRTIYQQISACIIKNGSAGVNESFVLLDKEIQRFLKDQVPLEDLTLSKSLKSSYKAEESIAHFQLAKRLKDMNFEVQYESGERIPFVFVERSKSKINTRKALDVIEHPLVYTQNNNLHIDKLYYLRKQFEKPIVSFFAFIAPERIVDYFQRLYKKEFSETLKVKVEE